MTKDPQQKLTCPLLYNHISINSFGQRVFCCISGYAPQENQEIFTSQFKISDHQQPFDLRLKQARDTFKQGRFPLECKSCEHAESLGSESFRQTNIERFPETMQDILRGNEPQAIEYIDIKLGNHCNLKCRMCNPYCSDALKDEYESIYPGSMRHMKANSFTWYKDPQFFDGMKSHLPTLKTLLFTGGEPFLIREMWQFIDDIIEQGFSKTIHLVFNTNFTIFNEDIFNKLKQFKKVTLYLSIDAVDDVYEVIRYPGKWSTIEKNLEKLNLWLKTDDRFEVIFFPSIQALNIFQLDRIFELPKKYENIPNKLDFNIVTFPALYCVSNLPKKCKADMKLKIMSELDVMVADMAEPKRLIDNLKGLLKLLEEDSKEEEQQEFLRVNSIFDQKRKQDLKDMLPPGWIPLFTN